MRLVRPALAAALLTTAALGDDLHRESRTFRPTVEPGSIASAVLACESGTLVSGGVALNDHPRTSVVSSYPTLSEGRPFWWGGVRNDDTVARDIGFTIVLTCSGPAAPPADAVRSLSEAAGARIYYQKTVQTVGGLPLYDVYSARPDGSDERRLTVAPQVRGHSNLLPDASPIRDEIVYISMRHRDEADRPGTGEIYIAGLDGSGERRLTDDTADDIDARWCGPDDASLIATRDAQIVEIDPDTGAVTPVVTSVGDPFGPACSPDGSRIAFSGRLANDHVQLYAANRDGTGIVPLGGPAGLHRHAVWARDGSVLLVTADRKPTLDGRDSLYSLC